jgi:ubiquinone/menaquinone biosynthesis C-methylase UbiE
MSNLINRLFFSLWYLRRPPWDTGVSPPELMDYIKSHPVGKALDLGCGTGTNVITLAKHGWHATGVDFVPRAIHAARKKAEHSGLKVKFQVGDVTSLDQIHDKFDLILDIGCFHSLPPGKAPAYAANLDRLLAGQGDYMVYGFRPSASTSNGLTSVHLEALSNYLNIARQEEGLDRRRPSVWIWYTRK